MTLQTFLYLTATLPEPVLRRALAIGLFSERPTSPEGYKGFYARVLAALCATSCTDDLTGVAAGPREQPRVTNAAVA